MATHLHKVKLEIIEDVNQQTVRTLDILTDLWAETFEDSICVANTEKLSEHVKTFYDDIIAETKTRQEKIKSNLKQLYSEAINLKQKLKVDINLNPDTDCPLYSLQQHLTYCLQSLRDQLEDRQGKINILLEEQKKLCIDLDEQPKELKNGSELPTKDDLIKFRQYLDNLIIEKHDRLNEFNKLRIDIEILLMKLDESIVNIGDDTMLNDPSLPLTKKNLSKLYILRTNLQNRYNDMREEIDKMKMKLEKLWAVFDLDDNIKTQFDDIEYNQENYNKISRALEYWEQERRSNLRKFVTNSREEIAYWLNKNLYSDLEKANISILYSDCFTEDLLTAHEFELKNLIDFYYEHEKLFCLIEERQRFWHQMHALEGKAQEPGRYTNRGGQLLKEEKERKKISKRLPAIENEILNLAEDYQKSTNKKFTVYGIPVAELIEQDWRHMNEHKEEVKFSRKILTESTTPVKPTKLKHQISTVKKVLKSVSAMASANRNNNENNRLHGPKDLLKNIPAQKKLDTKVAVKLTYPTEQRRLRKSNGRRVSTGRITKTHIQINNSALTDSVNYDSFKDYITPRTPCRSSMVSPKDKQTRAKASKKLPLTPIPVTPVSNKKLHVNKSPMANRNYSPRSSPSVHKFSTVNLPILI